MSYAVITIWSSNRLRRRHVAVSRGVDSALSVQGGMREDVAWQFEKPKRSADCNEDWEL